MSGKIAVIFIFSHTIFAMSPEQRLVIEHYTPSREFCRARINPDIYIPLRYEIEREIACVLFDFKNIVLITEKKLKKILDQRPSGDEVFESFKKIFKNGLATNKIHILEFSYQDPETKKKTTEVIIYSEPGKENAQLLAKHNPTQENIMQNSYLLGLLLGYSQDDIDFYYKTLAFQKLHNYTLPPSGEFVFWPQELKDKFYLFAKNDWQKSDEYKIYKADRKDALNWISKQRTTQTAEPPLKSPRKQ